MLKADLVKTEIVPCYGGRRVEYIMDITHQGDTFTNNYVVKAEVRWVDCFTIELDFNEVIETQTNNEETLTEDGVLELLNNEAY